METRYEVEEDWQTKAGYRAVCIAIKDMHRCGYIALPKEHFLHGVGYGQSLEGLGEAWKSLRNGADEGDNKRGPIITLLASCDPDSPDNWSPDRIINVHGGLTYAGGNDSYPVDHDGMWWFGFDCGHAGDGMFKKSRISSDGPIRDVDYVVDECESMAEQFKTLQDLTT